MLNTRVTVQFRFAIAALALLMVTNLMGCKADSNYFATSNSSVGSGDGSTSDATVGFRVRLKSKTGVDGFMHKFGDVNAACEIASTAIDTPTEINCMMNMMEYDLWFYGYEYEVNVPVGTSADHQFCAFLRERPHRYYKGEAGYGPDNVAIVMTDGALTGCSINGSPGTIDAVQKTCSNSEASFTSSGALATCVYDYSNLEGDVILPNCCGGTANVNLTTIVTVPPTAPTSTSSQIKYGGKVSNCLESVSDFIVEWPKNTDTGQGISLVTELGAGGLVRSQKLPSVMQLSTLKKRRLGPSDFLNAGFHSWSAYAANPATYDATAVIPRAMNPEYDRGADGSHTVGAGASVLPQVSTGAFAFECLNGAGEVRHRINMYANAWNTIEDYQDFKANGNPATVTPNRTGTAGVDCSAVNGLGSCNTIWGFDDMIADTSALGCAGDATAYCFPYEGGRPSPP